MAIDQPAVPGELEEDADEGTVDPAHRVGEIPDEPDESEGEAWEEAKDVTPDMSADDAVVEKEAPVDTNQPAETTDEAAGGEATEATGDQPETPEAPASGDAEASEADDGTAEKPED